MKKLSLLFFLAITFAGSSVYAQFTQNEMVKEWQRAKDYTKSYLNAMPTDGYNFKPTPAIRSFAQQMLHLADANYGLVGAASGKPSPIGNVSDEKTVAQTKEAVTKAVMDSYDWVIGTLQGMSAAQMQEAIKFANQEFTRSGMFGKAFEHQTHHRGQCTIYLRLKGVTPPNERLF